MSSTSLLLEESIATTEHTNRMREISVLSTCYEKSSSQQRLQSGRDSYSEPGLFSKEEHSSHLRRLSTGKTSVRRESSPQLKLPANNSIFEEEDSSKFKLSARHTSSRRQSSSSLELIVGNSSSRRQSSFELGLPSNSISSRRESSSELRLPFSSTSYHIAESQELFKSRRSSSLSSLGGQEESRTGCRVASQELATRCSLRDAHPSSIPQSLPAFSSQSLRLEQASVTSKCLNWPIEALPSLASQFSRPPNPEPRRITWGDTPSRRSRRKLQRRFPARQRLLAGRPAPGGRSAEGTLESAGSRRTGSPDRRHSDPGAGCQESGSDTWWSEARSQSLESSDRYLNSRGKLSVLDYQRFRVEVGSYSGAEQRPVPVLISGEYRLPERSSCRLWLHELGKELTTIR